MSEAAGPVVLERMEERSPVDVILILINNPRLSFNTLTGSILTVPLDESLLNSSPSPAPVVSIQRLKETYVGKHPNHPDVD